MSARRGERGAAVLLIMLSMSAMIALGGLAVLSVRGQTQASAHDRFRSLAMLGAESGVAAAMSFLRDNYDPDTKWSAFVVANNDGAAVETAISGNGVAHGVGGNPFSSDIQVDYEVLILNNPDDPGFATGDDTDSVVILRSTGRGPAGAVAILEVEFQPSSDGAGIPCSGYSQENQNELGSAFNPCQGTVNAGAFQALSFASP